MKVDREQDQSKKIKFLKDLSRMCYLRTQKNLIRDLPKLERTLCKLTLELWSSIQSLSGLDPRKLGAKKKYETLCADTAMACRFFRAFIRGTKIEGYLVTKDDVEEAVKTWIQELNRWANPAAGAPVWSMMHGKQIALKEITDPSIHGNYKAVDEFDIEIAKQG